MAERSFSGPLEDFDEVRARMRNEKRIDDAKRGGNSAEVEQDQTRSSADEANMAQKHGILLQLCFIYKVTVTTAATKRSIVDWDYVSFDAIRTMRSMSAIY